MKYLKRLIIAGGFLLGNNSVFSLDYFKKDLVEEKREFNDKYRNCAHALSLSHSVLKKSHSEVEFLEKKPDQLAVSLKDVKTIIDEFYFKQANSNIFSIRLGKVETVRFKSSSHILAFACSVQEIDEWQKFLKMGSSETHSIKEPYLSLAFRTSEEAKQRLKTPHATLVAFVYLNIFAKEVEEEPLTALARLATLGSLDFPNKTEISLNLVKNVKERLKDLEETLEVRIKESAKELKEAKEKERVAGLFGYTSI